MHYPLCVLVDVSVVEDDKPIVGVARERAIAGLAMYKGVEYDYMSTPDGRWPDLPMEVLGKDEPARLLELLEEYRLHPLREARYRWERVLEQSRKISQESAKLLLSAGDGATSTEQVQIAVSEESIVHAFSAEPPSSDYYLFRYLSYVLSVATGDFKCDSGFYCDLDFSTKVHSETMVRVREYPQWFALVFFDIHC